MKHERRLFVYCAPGVSPSWGTDVVELAKSCGWEAYPFFLASHLIGERGYVFMRIPQWAPEHARGKASYEALLQEPGLCLIPGRNTAMLYENKLMQAIQYASWMPRTIVATNDEGEHAGMNDLDTLCARAQTELGLPLLSKAMTGSASANVRKIDTPGQLHMHLYTLAGPGTPIKAGMGRKSVQHGYAILQQFLPGNEYDYRACVNGRYIMLLRRFNKSAAEPFASGSGCNEPVTVLNAETIDVLRTAAAFFEANGERWCGIDLVKDKDGRWLVLETTLAWSLPAYADAPYWSRGSSHDLWRDSGHKGSQQWQVLLKEIEAGSFDA